MPSRKRRALSILFFMEVKSVAGVVFSGDRKNILLIKRRDVPVWVLPGGGMDAKEKPDAAIIREILEETGFRVKVTRLIGVYFPINSLTKLTHLYECTSLGGSPTLSDETKGVRFFSLSELPLMPPPYEEWIEQAKKLEAPTVFRHLHSVTYRALMKQMLLHPFLVSRFLLARLGLPINT